MALILEIESTTSRCSRASTPAGLAIGFATGEWTGVSARATNTLRAGILVLLAAISVLAYANSLAS